MADDPPYKPVTPKIRSWSGSNKEIDSISEDSLVPSSPTIRVSSEDSKSRSKSTSFPEIAPKLTPFSSNDCIMMNLTPYASNDQVADDAVIFSDSDGLSQNSLDLRLHRTNYSSESEARSKSRSPEKTKTSRGRKLSNARKLEEDKSATPKSKKKIRRKSNKSDIDSDKSLRSSIRHSEYHGGSGYTSMQPTGKIFRNLLILEESLRQQVAQQRALRRKYLTFLAILCSLIASIAHHLYFTDPSQSTDGPFRVILQFILLALLVTVMLYHLSGEYQKTIVLPRKFLFSTNKGLRQLNVRLVKIKTPLTDNIIDLIREFSLFIATMCLNCLHKVYPSTIGNRNSKLEVFLVSCQAQCQPRIGVTDVKLVLNARVFNTDIREGWEIYRSEFWVHEGVRRRNNMIAFLNTNLEDNILDRGKLLKKDKKDRKDRRKSTVSNAINSLSEKNLKQLNGSLGASDDSIAAFASGFSSHETTPSPSSP